MWTHLPSLHFKLPTSIVLQHQPLLEPPLPFPRLLSGRYQKAQKKYAENYNPKWTLLTLLSHTILKHNLLWLTLTLPLTFTHFTLNYLIFSPVLPQYHGPCCLRSPQALKLSLMSGFHCCACHLYNTTLLCGSVFSMLWF